MKPSCLSDGALRLEMIFVAILFVLLRDVDVFH